MKNIIKIIESDLKIVKPTKLILSQYELMKKHLFKNDMKIINSFHQIKKNDEYSGLISETMFFNENYIYDIVIGKENIETNYIKTEHITKFELKTTPNYETDENEKQKILSYSSRLIIAYQEDSQLYYDIHPDRFSDLLELVNILTKTI